VGFGEVGFGEVGFSELQICKLGFGELGVNPYFCYSLGHQGDILEFEPKTLLQRRVRVSRASVRVRIRGWDSAKWDSAK
jgi:hypothetical protein